MFDFSPAALAVTNRRRSPPGNGDVPFGGRERGARPPSHPSVGWMLVMVYLTAVGGQCTDNRVTSESHQGRDSSVTDGATPAGDWAFARAGAGQTRGWFALLE